MGDLPPLRGWCGVGNGARFPGLTAWAIDWRSFGALYDHVVVSRFEGAAWRNSGKDRISAVTTNLFWLSFLRSAWQRIVGPFMALVLKPNPTYTPALGKP